jgi:hypothetical protein
MKLYKEEVKEGVEELMLTKYEQVHSVGPDFYQKFLNLPDKMMGFFIRCILIDGVRYVPELNHTCKWNDEEVMCNNVMGFMHLIAEGTITINAKNCKLCFSKAIGPKPTNEIEIETVEKIESLRPMILNNFKKLSDHMGRIEQCNMQFITDVYDV